ncbi:MAG: RecX family transcriptional regulator [Thermoleophilia bacterium]
MPEGRITGLEPQKRARGRTNVYVEGRFAFGVSDEILARAGLRVGDILTAEIKARLLSEEATRLVREKALRLLSTRERSRKELFERLREGGADEETIEQVLDRLEELAFLDDARFARAYAAGKRAAGWGDRRLVQELRRRGVARAVIEEALENLEGRLEDAESVGRDTGGSESVPDQLVGLIRRRYGQEFGRDPDRARRRAQGFLLRRGHDYEQIRRLLREAFPDC